MQAAGSMTRFATGLPFGTRIIEPNASMRAGRKDAAYVRVALRARLVADKGRARHIGSRGQGDGSS